MTARPNLSSIPGRGIAVDGIVDVLGGKSIVVDRNVGPTNESALKGEVLVIDGVGAVKTAGANAAKATVAGIAVTSAVKGEIISVLRQGIARLAVHELAEEGYDTAEVIAVGDAVSVYAAGKVCKTGVNGTTEAIGYVSKVGDGYVDVEINLLGAAV